MTQLQIVRGNTLEAMEVKIKYVHIKKVYDFHLAVCSPGLADVKISNFESESIRIRTERLE